MFGWRWGVVLVTHHTYIQQKTSQVAIVDTESVVLLRRHRLLAGAMDQAEHERSRYMAFSNIESARSVQVWDRGRIEHHPRVRVRGEG